MEVEPNKKAAPDLTLFRWIESQTSDRDREALLSMTEVVCKVTPTYRYLEVGSHLGGSLQPHVLDARCTKIYSIDPRPQEQPDERWASNYKYEGNSTERMLALLSAIPGANTGKIRTFEACSWDLSPSSIPEPIDFAFIDGEHTNTAVVRDFIAVSRFLSPAAILAFHDCQATHKAFLEISRILRRERKAHHFQYFPQSDVAAIVFGSTRLTELLRNSGWKKGLPHSQIKQFLKKHLPSLVSAVKRARNRRPA